MKRYIRSSTGDDTYTQVVVILADHPIKGYDDTYYLPEYKMYLKTFDTTINNITGEYVGPYKLHTTLIDELSGNNRRIPMERCVGATFKNGNLLCPPSNWEILSEAQKNYINSLF